MHRQRGEEDVDISGGNCNVISGCGAIIISRCQQFCPMGSLGDAIGIGNLWGSPPGGVLTCFLEDICHDILQRQRFFCGLSRLDFFRNRLYFFIGVKFLVGAAAGGGEKEGASGRRIEMGALRVHITGAPLPPSLPPSLPPFPAIFCSRPTNPAV